jgi:hypothetical protein
MTRVTLVLALVLLFGCSSSSKNTGGSNGADASSDGGGSGGSGAVGGGAGGGAGSAGTGGTSGGGDAGADAPCDPAEKPAAGAVFVSPTGSDANSGKSDFPVQTIGQAIGLAKASFATKIYLASGDYTLTDTLTFGVGEEGIVIEGGWTKSGPAWAPLCQPGRRSFTTISVAAAVAVRVQDLSKAAGLRHLKIATKAQGASPAGEPGESMFGVWVSGAQTAFNLYDIEVVAGAAGQGGDPPPAPSKPTTPATCDGATGCCTTEVGCGDNSVGPSPPAQGSAGADAPAGTFDSNGYQPGTGTVGPPGTKGHNGKIGSPGGNTGKKCSTTSCGNCLPGCPGTCSGTYTAGPTLVGGTGKCGCAGQGGGGGAGGRGGGSSVALLATDGATVSIQYVTLHAGKGGNGANGGAGGPGGDGAAGQPGDQGGCNTGCHSSCSGTCQCAIYSTESGGPPGTKGGAGGLGANGGGGSGGPSFSFVTVNASVSDGGNNGFIYEGGGAGVNTAASGASGPSWNQL